MGMPGVAHVQGAQSQPRSTTTTTKQPSHVPVEMNNLDASKRTQPAADLGAEAGASMQGLLNDVSIPSSSRLDYSTFMDDFRSADENAKPERTTTVPAADSQSSAKPIPTSGESSSTSASPQAIPRSTEGTPSTATSEPGPVLVITLLLGTGARHPFRIDEKYLVKRNVDVPGLTEAGRKDPFSISVYTLKELILREWREEWETQPSNPTNIRLIYFGRLLDDKSPLRDCKFNADSANVVHMTVRPQDIVDEEDAAKGKAIARDRDGAGSQGACRCVVQ
ncbi:hypothetical protein QTJ16_006482 [Diplocarpon rosae]|uniref:Ubiquitin-like domain-containing protein n=1 Tax=Diplocarpon rosae TaxID=946125 RepID=A0AAD9SWX7_9HELO|nr:hypothetical protein QTJ16_006482 [Diplocarpon rosae]PBP20612.1 ubiquitin-like protein [Diplocarpon rosae]